MNKHAIRYWPLVLALFLMACVGGCASSNRLGFTPDAKVSNALDGAADLSQPVLRLETGRHTARISRISTDRRGRWAVTASDDKTARIWKLADLSLAQVLRPKIGSGAVGKLNAVAMSPDGQRVAVGGTTCSEGPNCSVFVFDRASGQLLKRFSSLPGRVMDLHYAPNGRWLAAALGNRDGVRVLHADTGRQIGRYDDLDGVSNSVRFNPAGNRLAATSIDGTVHLFSARDGQLRLIASRFLGDDQTPYAARFSPDGSRLGVGIQNKHEVLLLDAESLKTIARPAIADSKGFGNLVAVEWSADGRFLVAGGRWANKQREHPVRIWATDDWGRYQDISGISGNTILDLERLPNGMLLFAAADPSFGLIDPHGGRALRFSSYVPDLRGRISVSEDAKRVVAPFPYGDFDFVDVCVDCPSDTKPPVFVARTKAPGLRVRNWQNHLAPTLNGKPLHLEAEEVSRSLAVSPDGRDFVLGAEWTLRRFDRRGVQVWRVDTPSIAWAVNWSRDGRFIVAAYGDGSIRWHRAQDGQEVLADVPMKDLSMSVVWTPEGFYDVQTPAAEYWLGYHINRGLDREALFIDAARLRERFYQPGLVARRLDPDGDALMADAVAMLGDARQLLTGKGALAPSVQILSGPEVSGEEGVTVRYRVRDQGGGIGTVRFFVNGKEWAVRPAGLFADETQSRTFTLLRGEQNFPLAPGEHQIEIAASNPAGVEGARGSVKALITGPSRQAALYVFAVGIDDYPDPRLRLKHSVRDAQAVAREFASRAGPYYGRERTRPIILTDAQATVSGIERAFDELARRIQPQDTLIVFLAGHGETSISHGYTFLTVDYDPDAYGQRSKGLNEQRLRAMLQRAPQNALLLIDTCDAGGAVTMLEKSYERLGDLSGHVVIGASRSGELAMEGYRGHGVFTAALLNVLREAPKHSSSDYIRVSKLNGDVREQVSILSSKIGGGYRQTVDGFVGRSDFRVARR